MTRIRNTVRIERPIEQVFEYVTTPAHWPEWHPASINVRDATDHSLEVDEQVTEEFRAAGRRGSVIWTVRERDAPRRWVIHGELSRGGSGWITYALTPEGGGTRFERELVYNLPDPLWRLLDRVVLRWRMRRESAAALRRLKAVLEGKAGPNRPKA